MATVDLNDILRALPWLKPHELLQVRTKVGASLSLCGVKEAAPVEQPPTDYLLDGMIFELRRRGLLGANSGVFKRLITPDYTAAASGVRTHLEDRTGSLKAVETQALGHLAARCLATYLEGGRVPVAPSTMIHNVAKIPYAMDASYPGYLEAGLLSFCWRK